MRRVSDSPLGFGSPACFTLLDDANAKGICEEFVRVLLRPGILQEHGWKAVGVGIGIEIDAIEKPSPIPDNSGFIVV